MERIIDAIADLPEQERIAITLTHIEGYTQTEAAEKMRISQPTVHRLCRRAIITMRRELAE